MSTASLGFAIDSSQAATAASDLDRLTSSAAKAEQAAARTSAAGSRMSRGFADLTPALDKIVGSLGRLEGVTTSIDKRLDMIAQAATRSAKANNALDQSAIEASTAYKQLEASLNAVQAAQRKGDASLSSSLAMIEKQRAAITKLNVELEKLRHAPAPVPGGGSSGGGKPANNNAKFAATNAMFQMQDIVMTSAMGMNPGMVALQQGSQLAGNFAGMSMKQAASSMIGGLAGMLGPLSLVTIGITAATSAAISYGMSLLTASSNTTKLDDALEKHDSVLKRLEDRYGSLIEKAKGFTAESSAVLAFEAGSDVRGLRNATVASRGEFFRSTGSILLRNYGGTQGGNDFKASGEFKVFEDALKKLRTTAKDGKPDFEAFYDSLYKTASLDPSYAKKADELAKLVAEYRDGTRALEEMERVQRRLFNDRGANGMLLSQGETNTGDMGNLALFESQNAVAARRRRQAFDAQIAGINARSPQERAAAARASAAAQYNGDETAAQRRQRIEEAGTIALAQAEKQLADARRDRADNLTKTNADQQMEIDLIGKTGGQVIALRREYELTSALRLEAAKQGIDVDQKELDLIKERSQELGRLTDQYNQRRFSFDMSQQASDARLSSRDLKITQTLRQYGLPEDLNGANASQISQQMQWQDTKDATKTFFTSFESSLIQNGGDIGDAFGNAIKNALMKQTEKLWDNLFDKLSTSVADWLLGSNTSSSGATSGGALASVAGSIFGGTKKAANDNSSAPATDIAAYITQAAVKRGIDPNVALNVAKSEGGLNSWNLQSGFVKNGVREQSFGPFQLYKGGGLGNEFMSKTGLDPALAANGPAATDFALDHAAKNGWGAWYGAKRVGIGNWEGIGANAGAGSAASTVTDLAKSAGSAAKSVDVFGGGLGKMGQALSTSYFPSAPSGGGGGLLGMLGGIFGGGLSSYGKSALSASSQFASAWSKGGIGLYASGTNYAPGGMAIVGEEGPELVNLPQGSQVFSNSRSKALMANDNGGSSSAQARPLTVVVQGASGDNHIRELARQGAQEAVYQDRIEQERGRFGKTQQTYNARKG